MGGRLEAFYFAFGDDDAYAIVDLPDDAASAAISMAVAGRRRLGGDQHGGQLGEGGTAQDRAPPRAERIDEAAKQSIDYRPPGT